MDQNVKQQILASIDEIPVEGEGGLLEFIDNGEISFDEMVEAGLSSSSQSEIASVKERKKSEQEAKKAQEAKNINKDEVCKEISDGEKTVGEIKRLIETRQITKADLLGKVGMSETNYNRIANYKKRPTNFHTWGDLPPIAADRTDLYFFGQPGSGKSCILASLFYHSEKEGLIIQNSINPSGNHYRDQLSNEIEFGTLPDSTSADKEKGVNYIPVDLIDPDDKDKIHPLNFIEMSGELFDKAYQEGISENNLNAKDYLDNDNRKLIFFVLDYDQHMERESGGTGTTAQASKFQNVLSLLDDYGTLKKTDGIYIIISKSDLFPEGSDKSRYAEKFFKDNYRNLYTNCKHFEKEYNMNFELTLYPYYLGDVMYKNLLVRFDHKPPSDLLRYVCDDSFIGGKQGFLKKLFS
jgi:hypothetical protein